MELKLRRKGEFVLVDEFPRESVPKSMRAFIPENLDGIDFTAYSVIYITGGRHVPDKAKKMAVEAPKVIIVYKYSWRNGWGEGIIIPEGFNPSQVRFYKTSAQAESEEKAKVRQGAKELQATVNESIQGVKAYGLTYNEDGVEIMPIQEAFADWWVVAKTFVEAQEEVAKRMPLWKEWNVRAVEIYRRMAGQEPTEGSIQIYPSPTRVMGKRVGIRIRDGEWVIFEKRDDGAWEETGVSHSAPSH